MKTRTLFALVFAYAMISCSEPETEVIQTPEEMNLEKVIRDACGHQSEIDEAPSKILRKSVLPESMIESLFPVWPKTTWGYGACNLWGVEDLVLWDQTEQTSEEGFFVIGSCPNGDDVAFKISDKGPWPVYYLGHELLGIPEWKDKWAVKVADSLSELLIKGNEDENFPMDHYDATEANNSK